MTLKQNVCVYMRKHYPWNTLAAKKKYTLLAKLSFNSAQLAGDDLYGAKAERLYLHAESLTLKHPSSKEEMHFTCKAEF